MRILNIVLIEPQIPQNTGNVARTCAVTGARLHLVGPLGFEIDDAKLKRAGLDYWGMLDITYYKDLSEFLQRFTLVRISHARSCSAVSKTGLLAISRRKAFYVMSSASALFFM